MVNNKVMIVIFLAGLQLMCPGRLPRMVCLTRRYTVGVLPFQADANSDDLKSCLPMKQRIFFFCLNLLLILSGHLDKVSIAWPDSD